MTTSISPIDLSAPNPLDTINRSEMSRQLGVDIAHISRILSGKRNTSLNMSARIADYLGITIDQLFILLKTPLID